jgi:hypothetical protein
LPLGLRLGWFVVKGQMEGLGFVAAFFAPSLVVADALDDPGREH